MGHDRAGNRGVTRMERRTDRDVSYDGEIGRTRAKSPDARVSAVRGGCARSGGVFADIRWRRREKPEEHGDGQVGGESSAGAALTGSVSASDSFAFGARSFRIL